MASLVIIAIVLVAVDDDDSILCKFQAHTERNELRKTAISNEINGY